ncbi:hypothetical protein [Mesorhizobium sp. ES1-3]|nr:hypothetical protein [Mesorhizobium sp. ES1-3]
MARGSAARLFPYASITSIKARGQEKQCRRVNPSGIFLDWLPPFQ